MRYSLIAASCLVVILSSAAAMADSYAPEEKQGVLQMPSQHTLTPSMSSLPVARNGEIIDSVGGGATEAVIPDIKQKNGIDYITGGVGEEELEAIKAQEQNFNVRILASSSQGEYMGEMAFRFLDDKGVEVFRVYDAGPYLYANLPVGKYTIEGAAQSGEIQRSTVNAMATPPKTGRIVLRFK